MPYEYVPLYIAKESSESDGPSDDQASQQITSDIMELYRRNGLRPDISPTRPQRRAVTQAQNSGGIQDYKPTTRMNDTSSSNLKTMTQAQKPGGTYYHKRMRGYYRRVPSHLCKRRSLVCVPLTCQPDPATHYQPRKASTDSHPQEAEYAADYYEDDKATTAIKRTDTTRPMDSEGDVNSKLSHLENFLNRFGDDEDKDENEKVEISGIDEISKILKPKIPASVKTAQKSLKLRSSRTETVAATENKWVSDVSGVGDISKILQSKCYHGTGEMLPRNKKNELKQSDEKPAGTNEGKEVPRTNPENYSKQKHVFHLEQRPPLDDNSALELHKSKSYIVSLIDKALSKELGTVSGDTRKEFYNMNPKKAVDIINRHSSPKDLQRVDFARPSSSTKKDDECVLKTDEPLYVKQLKQLRWTHLRHIQREAKRLADLEKFLDSISEVDSQI